MKREIPVVGLACSQCAAHVEQCLQKVKGVQTASVSLLLRTATVDYDPATTSLAAMKNAVNAIGYDLITDDNTSVQEIECRAYRVLRRQVAGAWLFALAAMALSMHWLTIGSTDLENQALLLLALLALLTCGRQYYVAFLRNARQGRTTMDTLIALSTGITFLFSAYNTFFGADTWTPLGIANHTYFETTTMILAFVLTGRLLEERAKDSTASSIRQLMGIAPKTAHLVVGDSDAEHTLREIPIGTIRKGDRLAVRAGDKIPTDGIVVRAESFMDSATVYVDESMLTGEPTPVGKSSGATVLAGTLVSQGHCIVEARVAGGATAVSQIVSVVREALESKAAVQRLADKAAAVFVPTVLAVAAVTFVCWCAAGGVAAVAQALLHAIAVLVVACPCAMGLAAPTALMVGIGKAAKQHILIKDVAALERLSKVDAMVVDKTGTLTIANPHIDFTKTDLPPSQRETLKPNAPALLAALAAEGIEVHMMSGDTEEAVAYWAAQLRLHHYRSRVMPQDKEALVRQLQQQGHRVAMVGDGINDTQALAAADVSIAMGSGTDLAMDIAQVTLLADDLLALHKAVLLSRRTVRMLWQNLFWAFIYNIIFIPLAAGVPALWGASLTLTPMVASVLMALSSLSVVLNSLRLNRE